MSQKSIVEAALFVSQEPISTKELAKKTGLEEKEVQESLEHLITEYSKREGGILVEHIHKKYRMTLNPKYEDQVLSFIPETDMPKAMVKCLALISYEQPIKQSFVVKIRGTRAYHYIKKLTELGLIESKMQGRTKILSTTPKFQKYFNLKKQK